MAPSLNPAHDQYIEALTDLVLASEEQDVMVIEIVEFLKEEFPEGHDEMVILLKKGIEEGNAVANKYLKMKGN